MCCDLRIVDIIERNRLQLAITITLSGLQITVLSDGGLQLFQTFANFINSGTFPLR